MSIFHKLIYRFNTIQSPTDLFFINWQTDSKNYMESKELRRAKTILKKKIEGFALPHFKTSYKAILTKAGLHIDLMMNI